MTYVEGCKAPSVRIAHLRDECILSNWPKSHPTHWEEFSKILARWVAGEDFRESY